LPGLAAKAAAGKGGPQGARRFGAAAMPWLGGCNPAGRLARGDVGAIGDLRARFDFGIPPCKAGAGTAPPIGRCRVALTRTSEIILELFRARRERRYALVINDPQPVASVDSIWGPAARLATVGIFLMALGAGLYFARPVLLPIFAALIVGMTLAPIVKHAQSRHVPPWLTALLLLTGLLVLAGIVVTLLSAPLVEWIGRAPDIAAQVKEKLYVLGRPLAALNDLQKTLMPPAPNTVKVETSGITLVAPVIATVTPAIGQLVIFSATLVFFLIGQADVRRQMASLFSSRDAKLRFIRIAGDIEYNLASYVATVSLINAGLGVAVAVGAWLFGLPNPAIFGLVAALLNFIPYIGAACTTVILFAVSLITFPSLGHALLPPAAFVALATIEGQILTPAILGHRLELNPFLVFVALVFWAWLWGPMGAFLAVPLSIIGMVVFNHVMPSDADKLPD
jgi:predicted PurR-regulated permease PerM